jgi:hypothetical protein
MFSSFRFPDPDTGEELKTTAESAEAAEIAEGDLSVHVPISRIFSADSGASVKPVLSRKLKGVYLGMTR